MKNVSLDEIVRPHRRTVVAAIAVMVGYYLGARIGMALTLHPHPISTLWPPNSILMAALLLAPTRLWPILILAAFPAHLAAELQSEVPIVMVLAWFASNCSEALIGAWLIKRVIHGAPRFDSLRHTGVFILFGAIAAPLLSSFIDAGFIRLIGWGEGSYWELWRSRTLSNVLAALSLIPVIVLWGLYGIHAVRRVSVRRTLEVSGLALGLIGVSIVLFGTQPLNSSATPVLLYALLPFLLWAAVRLGPVGTSTCLLVVVLVALWTTTHSHGLFALTSPSESTFSVQLFLIAVSVPMLLLAALIESETQTKEALRRSEEQLRLALSAAKIGTWEWHVASDTVVWSEISMNLFQVTQSKLERALEVFSSTLHPRDRENVLRALERAVNEGAAFEWSYRVLRPTGDVYWVMSKGEVLRDAAGRAVRVVGVNVDITDQKQIELQLEHQRQQLTYLTRVATLGELSGALAHELNQPLTAILSNAQTAQILIERKSASPSDIREILDDVVKDCDRAGVVIRRLDALFKKRDLQLHAVDVNEVVRDALSIAHGELVAHNVYVTTELESHLDAVSGDRVQLQQVLLNLIVNACEAMNGNDVGDRHLIVRTEAAADGGVRVSVSDCGSGLAVKPHERLFEAFYTTKENGLGLGLSISGSIIALHGGRLSAKNNADRGATFYFDLRSEIGRVTSTRASA